MRIVLDTNVIVSGLLVPEGTCGKVLRVLERPGIVLLTSPTLLDELAHTLRKKIGYTADDAARVITEVRRIAEIVLPISHVDVVRHDPTDNRVLECALDGRADCVVSGDKKHLLPLRLFRSIPIITAAELLRKFDQ